MTDDKRDMSKVRSFWNERGKMERVGGTNDQIAQEIEEKILLARVPENAHVCDIGCGDGNLLFQLHAQKQCHGIGVDYSQPFIEQCNENNTSKSLKFEWHDIAQLDGSLGPFDVVITKRCLINLENLEAQKAAFGKIINLLKPTGIYLMVEAFDDGNEKLNELRIPLGLEPMKAPWHNLYFKLDDVLNWAREFPVKLQELSHFSSTYYFLSRVVNAKIARDNNEDPRYDSEINKVALDLPPYGEFGATKLLIWGKN